MTDRIEARLCIPADHPALPGHFPGEPVVPGVVLLDRLIEAMEESLGEPVHVTGLPQVKFLSPLLPGEEAHAVIELGDSQAARSARFRIERSGIVIAQGKLAWTSGALAGVNAP